MKREIVLDTETTGMDPMKGDRVIEIGCVETANFVSTGRTFHVYIDPERDVPAEAVAVHGITGEFLKGKPKFMEIADQLIEFIGDSTIIAHNASFDMKFINAELVKCGYRAYDMSRAVDTVAIAKRQAPGAQASLDALCRRFGIDNSNRTLHGALLDAELLAEVYLELRGGRQPDLVLGDLDDDNIILPALPREGAIQRVPRPHQPSADEWAAHLEFMKQIKEPIWAKYADKPEDENTKSGS